MGMRLYIFLLVCIISLPVPVYSQIPSNLWLSLYFEAIRIFDESTQNIKEFEEQIRKNQQTIAKAQAIIIAASKRTDQEAREAEKIARESLAKAEGALRRNQAALVEWKQKRVMAQDLLATLQNTNRSVFDTKVKGFISDYSGRVEIFKANGEKVYVDRMNTALLESGDRVMTYDGTADVQFLDGRANAKLAPYSEIRIEKDSPAEQVIELVKGKVYTAVDKMENFINKIKTEGKRGIEAFEDYLKDENIRKNVNREVYEEYKRGIQAIGEYIKDKELREKVNKDLIVMLCSLPYPSNPSVITLGKFPYYTCGSLIPVAVFGVRGTKFVLNYDGKGNGDLYVIEGIVEVTTPEGRTFSVNGGYKITLEHSRISESTKYEHIDKWWEVKE